MYVDDDDGVEFQLNDRHVSDMKLSPTIIIMSNVAVESCS